MGANTLSSPARGNTLRTALLASGAIVGAAVLAACGSKSEVPVATATPPVPNTNPNETDDPCLWNPNHHRPLIDDNGVKKLTVDSRCTKPADGLTYVYKLPKNGKPTQERSEAVRDANGEAIGLPVFYTTIGKCVVKGDFVRNDLAVGSEWWVEIDKPDNAANVQDGPTVIPEVHVGFPLHDVQHGVSAGPGSIPVC